MYCLPIKHCCIYSYVEYWLVNDSFNFLIWRFALFCYQKVSVYLVETLCLWHILYNYNGFMQDNKDFQVQMHLQIVELYMVTYFLPFWYHQRSLLLLPFGSPWAFCMFLYIKGLSCAKHELVIMQLAGNQLSVKVIMTQLIETLLFTLMLSTTCVWLLIVGVIKGDLINRICN